MTQASARKYFGRAHKSVRDSLTKSISLSDFLEIDSEISLTDRLILIEQALVLFEQNYAHLPLKRAMYGIDPVQQLRLWRQQLKQNQHNRSLSLEPGYSFHQRLLSIFNSVHDLHTQYRLPKPFANNVAFLPFQLESYKDKKKTVFVVSHIATGFSHRFFKTGVIVTHWNGVPVNRAVSSLRGSRGGGNEVAHGVRALDAMTIRPIDSGLPPETTTVDCGYIDDKGKTRVASFEWHVTGDFSKLRRQRSTETLEDSESLGLDESGHQVGQSKLSLFAPQALSRLDAKSIEKSPLNSRIPSTLRAEIVQTAGRQFGHLRIFTFHDRNEPRFIEEVIRLIEQFPNDGLILDVRGNAGGNIRISESLLQFFSPHPITPQPVQFLNTPFNLSLCEKLKADSGIDFSPWVPSMREALKTGAIHSHGFPITPVEQANAWGQRYHGPVVLITDARCYSATDFLAAGFQDHDIGPILGVDDNTGAGGANVWRHGMLREWTKRAGIQTSPYKALPKGARMQVALRRSVRTGERAGVPVEDIGVVPTVRHELTRADVLNGNQDLLRHAGTLLKGLPSYLLKYNDTNLSPDHLDFTLETAGVDRVDIYMDDRPVNTRTVNNGEHQFTIDIDRSPEVIEIAGYANDNFVATRRVKTGG